MCFNTGLLHRRIQKMHNFFTENFDDQVIFDDMVLISPQEWFDTCIDKTRKWLKKSIHHMMVVESTNLEVEESRSQQHRLAHFSPKPVAMLLGVDVAEQGAEAAAEKCTRMTRGLVPEFERALERSDGTNGTNGTNPPAGFAALCVQARDIVSEMSGKIVGYGAEVDILTIDSIHATRTTMKKDMAEAVRRAEKIKWIPTTSA